MIYTVIGHVSHIPLYYLVVFKPERQISGCSLGNSEDNLPQTPAAAPRSHNQLMGALATLSCFVRLNDPRLHLPLRSDCSLVCLLTATEIKTHTSQTF